MNGCSGDPLMRGVARITVRRHLADLVGDGVTEEALTTAFLAWLEDPRTHSVSMKEAAFRFRLDYLAWLHRQTERPSITVKELP